MKEIKTSTIKETETKTDIEVGTKTETRKRKKRADKKSKSINMGDRSNQAQYYQCKFANKNGNYFNFFGE